VVTWEANILTGQEAVEEEVVPLKAAMPKDSNAEQSATDAAVRRLARECVLQVRLASKIDAKLPCVVQSRAARKEYPVVLQVTDVEGLSAAERVVVELPVSLAAASLPTLVVDNAAARTRKSAMPLQEVVSAWLDMHVMPLESVLW
jgi:hypothetical protein